MLLQVSGVRARSSSSSRALAVRRQRAELRLLLVLSVATGVAACSIYDAALLDSGKASGNGGSEVGGAAGSEPSGAAGATAGASGIATGGAAGDDAGAAGTGGSAGTTGGDGGSGSAATGGTGGTGGSVGGGAGQAGTGSVGAGGCSPSRPPERVFGAPDGGAIALLGAISDVDLGEDPAVADGTRHRALGYDLDAQCSLSGSGSCPAPGWPTLFEADGADGRDNTAGAFFERLSDTVPALASSAYTSRIRQGTGTTFLRVEGYNGGADDAVVSVSMSRTLAHAQPAWSGIDVWTLAAEDHAGELSQPKFRDAQAYVSSRVVVAHFSSLTIRLPNPDGMPLDIPLTRAVLTCRLEPNSVVQPFQARGCVLSGAWHHRDLLGALKTFPAAEPGGPALCRDAAAYPSLRALLCERVDLNAVAGSASACNALSFALRFETIGAFQNTQTLGTLPLAPARCTAPDTDPAFDTCN